MTKYEHELLHREGDGTGAGCGCVLLLLSVPFWLGGFMYAFAWIFEASICFDKQITDSFGLGWGWAIKNPDMCAALLDGIFK